MDQEPRGFSHETNSEDSFRLYEKLMAPANATHPQHQGLSWEEFEQALHNPDVYKTRVEIEGASVELPQLTPVSAFEWLNTPVYDAKFPEAAESGHLFQYTDLPGVEPGENVKEKLREIIANQGVVVFDYPDSDPEYSERVVTLLKEVGAGDMVVERLAEQTYFAGQVALKRKLAQDLGYPLDIADAFDAAVRDGDYDPARERNGASLKRVIDHDLAVTMNQFYDDAYVDLNEKEFCSQGLSGEEFLEMMEDEDVIKILNTVEGEVVSLLLLENKLEELSWVNADYYKTRYPDKYAKGQVMWFPGLAANPNHPGGMNTQVMVNLIAELVEKGDNEITVVFDCGILNTGFLDVFLNEMINKTPQAAINIQPIARQHYAAIRTSSSK